MNTFLKRAAPLAFVALLLPALVYGSQASIPNQFVNGDVADADQVNANFNALADAINDNDTRLTVVEGTAVIRVPHTPGDDVASGQALRAAIDSIPTNPSIDSYKIQLEPGVYDLGSMFVSLPDGLALCGAGRERTVLRSAAADSFVLDGDAHVEIYDLALVCRPPMAGGRAIRIINVSAHLVLRHVRIDYVGLSAKGIRTDGGTLDLADTEIFVEGTGPVASPSGIELGSLSPTGPEPTLKACCCEITVTGANTARGVLVNRGQAVLTRTTIRATSATSVGLNMGVNSDATESIEAHGCRVFGVRSLQKQGMGSLRAACCQLEGQRLGDVTIVHCYDGNFAAIP